MKIRIKIFLVFGIFFLLCFNSKVLASSTWETVIIERLIVNNIYLLEDGRKITLLKIKIPEVGESKENKCARKIRRFLKEKLNRRKVLIKVIEKKDQLTILDKNILDVYLKFKTGNEFFSLELLKQGFGVLENEDLNYFKAKFIEAENVAIFSRKGLWSNCNNFEFANDQVLFAKKDILKERYGTYLNNISVGIVKEVFSGNSFILENGLKIKLIGVESPLVNDQRKSFACFGKLSKQKLAEKILGKRVFLEKDNSQLSEYRELLRYVKIPKTRKSREIFINKEMIKEGFGKSFFDNYNKYYQEYFRSIQRDIYTKKPIGAWNSCLSQVINDEREIIKTKLIDKSCVIKGNISGTKKNPRRTFHTIESGWYNRIKAERCFDNEKDAINAGFFKIK